jgi:acetylornithine deacetylase/succinyl-diaminopimelate desuccinylase-like protein
MLFDTLKILFRYNTENTTESINSEIFLCLKEISSFLKRKGINNYLQKYEVKLSNGSKIKRANLLAYDHKNKGPFILFQGHIDTIPANSAFTTKINQKRIIGRGAVDMKGNLAGMIDALFSLNKISKKLKYPPALLITGDEEANSFAGIRNFLKQRRSFPVLFSICGEPSNFEVQTYLRGVIGYVLEKKGKEGHSAYPAGKLLIEEMIPVLKSVNDFLEESRKIKDKNFGHTIGALTTIISGAKDNQLPGSFRTSFNLRTVKSKKEYDKIFKRTIVPKIDKSIKLKSFGFNPLMVKIPEELKIAIKNSFAEVGINYRESSAIFFTEASLMNNKGIPAFVCGPGNPRLAHVAADKEAIKIKDIEKYSKLLKTTVININKAI